MIPDTLRSGGRLTRNRGYRNGARGFVVSLPMERWRTLVSEHAGVKNAGVRLDIQTFAENSIHVP